MKQSVNFNHSKNSFDVLIDNESIYFLQVTVKTTVYYDITMSLHLSFIDGVVIECC